MSQQEMERGGYYTNVTTGDGERDALKKSMKLVGGN